MLVKRGRRILQGAAIVGLALLSGKYLEISNARETARLAGQAQPDAAPQIACETGAQAGCAADGVTPGVWPSRLDVQTVQGNE